MANEAQTNELAESGDVREWGRVGLRKGSFQATLSHVRRSLFCKSFDMSLPSLDSPSVELYTGDVAPSGRNTPDAVNPIMAIKAEKLRSQLPVGVRRFCRKSSDWLHRLRGWRILYCFGDSHVGMYRHIVPQGHLGKTIIRTTYARGATAYGIANPNSRSNALNIFRQRLGSISSRDHLLFMLGEVDCGAMIWHRAVKRARPVGSLMEESLANYQAFLSSVIGLGYENLIVSTIPLPVILDSPPIGETTPVRPEVPATLAERTGLTLRYNARLREYCAKMSLRLLDFEADLLDETSGVVRRQFLRKDPLDHHLEFMAVAPVLARKLRQLGFS